MYDLSSSLSDTINTETDELWYRSRIVVFSIAQSEKKLVWAWSVWASVMNLMSCVTYIIKLKRIKLQHESLQAVLNFNLSTKCSANAFHCIISLNGCIILTAGVYFLIFLLIIIIIIIRLYTPIRWGYLK